MNVAQKVLDIQHALAQYSNPEKQIVFPKFFKTGKGEYGEGDKFLGVVVPNIRAVAKECKAEPLEVAEHLIDSEWHECRMCALLMLVEKYKKGSAEERERIFRFYLNHSHRINNWDLVDLSCPQIVGEHLLDKPRDILYRLAQDPFLWNQRIAVLATFTFIRHKDYADILRLADYFIKREGKLHDLMQKAVGWMLREMGKRNNASLLAFLDDYAAEMPRTMLRYAIEKLPSEQRKEYMEMGKVRR